MQFLIVLIASTVIASVGSHIITEWLRIETTAGHFWEIGQSPDQPPAFLAGSSLAGNAISWPRVSEEQGQQLKGWAVAGSSPWEWESFQQRANDIQLTFLVVSAYDLNEHFLCDFHADTVAFSRTVMDLWLTHADWRFTKRVLSQYPLKYLRTLFPSAGRSEGVLGGLRETFGTLFSSRSPLEAEAGPTFTVGQTIAIKSYQTESITNWDRARLLRRLAIMRGASQGRQSFDGPKQLAFVRMLRMAQERGRVVVIVLPVSPAYAHEFLSPDIARNFDDALTAAQRSVPAARWVRLDYLPALNSDRYFWDLVHMNTVGQHIATKALIDQLQTFPRRAS